MFDSRSFDARSFDSRSFLIDGAVAEEAILAGAGYPIRIHKQKKHKRIDDVIEKSMREMYEGVIELATPKVKKQAAKIVRPYIEKGVKPLTIPPAIIIDWAELERDAARVSALLELWQERDEAFARKRKSSCYSWQHKG